MSESTEEVGGGTAEATRKDRKVRQGVVVSDRGEKTIVVRVDRNIRHPLYHKAMVRSKKFHVHDEKNEYRVGDVVRIQETRPLSKLKRWRVLDLVERPERI
ncbi:MAG: 30S ribosomal protein S17 [Gemmatimonadota bacterium]